MFGQNIQCLISFCPSIPISPCCAFTVSFHKKVHLFHKSQTFSLSLYDKSTFFYLHIIHCLSWKFIAARWSGFEAPPCLGVHSLIGPSFRPVKKVFTLIQNLTLLNNMLYFKIKKKLTELFSMHCCNMTCKLSISEIMEELSELVIVQRTSSVRVRPTIKMGL